MAQRSGRPSSPRELAHVRLVRLDREREHRRAGRRGASSARRATPACRGRAGTRWPRTRPAPRARRGPRARSGLPSRSVSAKAGSAAELRRRPAGAAWARAASLRPARSSSIMRVEVGAEALVARRALERRVAAVALALALAVEAEVLRRRDQHVVHEDRRVARHAEAPRQLRVAVVLDHEARLAAELLRPRSVPADLLDRRGFRCTASARA